MESLPHEILIDIVTRLPITSLMQFKCVSKAWYSLAQDHYLLHMYATQNNPCIILQSEHSLDDQLHVIDTDRHQYENLTRKLAPPFKFSMPKFNIAGSCNGIHLCSSVSQESDTIFIYNPFTNESKQLPPTNTSFSNQKVVLGFGFDQKTMEYKVVRIVYRFPPGQMVCYGTSDVSIHTLGTNSWRSLGEAGYLLDGRSPPALVNGSLHWLAHHNKHQQYQEIVRFDLATEEFSKVPTPNCNTINKGWITIVEFRGCLSAVVHYNSCCKIEVWVMKDYNVKESWNKEFVIPAHSPVGFKPDINLSNRMLEKWFSRGYVRILCRLKSGEFLLEYGNQSLVSYDPDKEEFKDLNFEGLPISFDSVAFMGNLVPLQRSIHVQI
ncbi:hypothetical protein Syun_026851 [Stephania yunnanensis]|uniref:F-box domain-containing protein n=1 Tax=Stephania yunnanensis TaxID=152371 RepID=A0AAP0EGS8_9MAGN